MKLIADIVPFQKLSGVETRVVPRTRLGKRSEALEGLRGHTFASEKIVTFFKQVHTPQREQSWGFPQLVR